MKTAFTLLLMVSGTALQAQETGETVAAPSRVRLEPVLTGLPEITVITHAGDGSGKLYLATQRGRVLVVDAQGTLEPTPLVDLGPLVLCCGERGLLGLAFDPDYRSNGHFYVSFSDRNGDSAIARLHRPTDGGAADPAGMEVLLGAKQPAKIHNGGALAFGPDGNLYISLGDGGHFGGNEDSSGNDPNNNGQRLDTLLGKILRLDVRGGSGYAIPADNPYRNRADARPEIWASGLRNPWRIAFDRQTGELFIADVGPSSWEEINLAPAGRSGLNFGWARMLGNECFNARRCDRDAFTDPIIQYDHTLGCAVIGGYPYRGQAMAGVQGLYLYTDFCSGVIWGAERTATGRWQSQRLAGSKLNISSFGEDQAGELYVAHYHPENGTLYRLVLAQ